MALRLAGDFDTSYGHDMAVIRTRGQWLMTLVFLVALFALPFFAGSGVLGTLNLIGISIIVVHGLNLLVGYTGQISLGQAAFMSVGAYTSAVLVKNGVSFWLALPTAGFVAGMVGLLFGLPALRIKGFYLAMATLSAQFIIPWFFRNVREDIFGGMPGLRVPPPELGGIIFNSQQTMYFPIMGVVVLCTIVAKNIARTRLGRAFVAIRDSDLAAEVLGIHGFTYKLRAFFLSAFYAGLAGSLWAHYARSINPEQFSLLNSVWYLGMVIVGGMGSALGPILGATFIRLLEETTIQFSPLLGKIFPEVQAGLLAGLGPLLFGLVLMLFLVFEPRGLAHRWELLKAAWRLRPFAH
ncbi:MAG: branched-chain amino acid ABC transporter permease [Chloroflexi bacterium]|nr:branched-chain amino acid ABC transporter permease [Chloroflexota bacterium]MBI4790160.1 branched-chain amino acid ABC transporter permease [Chloroflexota bacterium]